MDNFTFAACLFWVADSNDRWSKIDQTSILVSGDDLQLFVSVRSQTNEYTTLAGSCIFDSGYIEPVIDVNIHRQMTRTPLNRAIDQGVYAQVPLLAVRIICVFANIWIA